MTIRPRPDVLAASTAASAMAVAPSYMEALATLVPVSFAIIVWYS
ncbi:MAG: hypothetical protein A4E73_01656 [Syntrophaceae bacterium PtaU1.Bin231]|nr:MAG: hypothetical protein A4E73_01656 [Syntrophaceae bacterium PtaU1.Bin231]